MSERVVRVCLQRPSSACQHLCVGHGNQSKGGITATHAVLIIYTTVLPGAALDVTALGKCLKASPTKFILWIPF